MSGRILPVFWVLASISAALLIPAAVAADGPVSIAPAPGADLGPVVAVGPEGQAWVAWKHVAPDGSQAELLLASSPDWTPAVVAPLDPALLAQTNLALSAQPGVVLTWSHPVTATQALHQQTWPPDASSERGSWSLPLEARWAVDHQGFWHAAWAAEDAIHTATNASPLTLTLPISPTTIAELALAIDSANGAHLAWALRDQAGAPLGIYYTPVVSGTQPVLVAPGGRAPRLVLGPSGRAHLFWVDSQGLRVASSADWTRSSLVVPGFQATHQLALAAGADGEIHLAWSDGQALWHAHSADWPSSLQRLPAPAYPSDPAMALDRYGRLHLAWASINPDDALESDLAYLRPLPFALQAAVAYPQEGDALAADSHARVIINGPPEDVLRVEFYLQVRSDAVSDIEPLRSLGIDRNGKDGWSAPLRVSDLEPWLGFRVLALATTTQGSLLRAEGGWFSVQRPDLPAIWFWPLDTLAGPGDASLSALLVSEPGQLRRVDLYLAPAPRAITNTVPESACPPPNAHYLGSFNPSIREQWPAATWQPFAYDRRLIPDGLYRPVAVGIDALGNRLCERSSHLVDIDDTMAPRVQITEPRAGALVRNELYILAEAGDDNGTVRHVDFYLERPAVVLQPSGPAAALAANAPELLWLGTDSNGRDGWSLRLPVRPEMDGDGWRVRAIAFDDQGLSSTARSPGTIDILARPRPYMATLLPSAGSRLWGIQPISLFITEGLQHLSRAELYVEDHDGAWTYLGVMADADGRLQYQWNTRDWPDATYTLVVAAQHADGHRSWFRRPDIHVQNGSSFYLFRRPTEGQVLSGTVPLRVGGGASALPLNEASFYYRKPGAELVPIAQVSAGAAPMDQLSALWYTDTVLDGDYELVAVLVDAQGTESRAICPVTVRNVTPFIDFRATQFQPAWIGLRRISWQASSPIGRPLSVTVQYSPDDGAHWLALASEITATNTFSWTTSAYPDSIRGRLRLSASDGFWVGRVVSPPFAVNNDNEPPHVMLLGPLTGRSYAGPVPITWRASDPDGDELRIDIAYRRGSGEWVGLAQGLPNQGSYAWDTQGLEPSSDYEVRVTAVDARLVAASDIVTGVSLVANKPPEVLLMWPHGGTRLEGDAVILWRATDPDNDELRVDLHYSDNAGQTWIPLVEDLPNTGYYQWQVSFLPLGTHYRVRVLVRDRFSSAEDRSKGNFSIGRQIPPTISLVYPAAGSEIQGIQLVRWARLNSGSGQARVSVLVRRVPQAEGSSREWVAIAPDVANDGFFLWNTRALADGRYDLKLVIRDGDTQAETTLSQPLLVNNGGNHPPQIVLQAPRGGELWSGWREILWQAWDGDRDPITATVSISSDAGQHWTNLVSLDARAGHALWDTRTVPSAASYWLRIAVTDGQSATQVATTAPVHIANGPGYPPSMFLPGLEASGSAERRIRVPWVAEDVDGDILTIGLALSDDGGLSWREVAGNLYNAGQHALEGEKAPIGPYRVRLRVDDGVYQVESFAAPSSDVPSADSVSLLLLSPRGGERWSGEQEIRWQLNGAHTSGAVVDIECSRDGGQTYKPLASGLRQVSSFPWDTRSLPNGVYFLRLVLRTERATSVVISEPLTLDNSGSNRPLISLLSPHGGETWGGTREVRWRATDPDGDPLTISLSYSVNRGTTWTAMTVPSSNTGSYIWDTTTMPNADEVWLRAIATDGQSTAMDTSDGPLAIYNHRAPTVALLSPRGGEQWAGDCRIEWLATREGGRSVQVAVEVSADMGKTWQTLADGLPGQGSYLWDTSGLPNQTRALVRVQATDGAHSAIDMVPQAVILRNRSQPRVPFFLP